MSDTVEQKRLSPPSWMDKAFFQTALRSGDQDPTITVEDFTITMAIAVGDNYCSDMYRASVNFSRGASPLETRSLIVKCQPIGGMREEVVLESNMFPTEIYLFTKVLPEMFRLLEEAAPGKFKRFGAKCLHHGLEPKQFIVLEDLASRGYKMGKRWDGLDLKHSMGVMKLIGQFHAASKVLLEKNPDLLTSISTNMFDESKDDKVGRILRTAIKSAIEEIDKRSADYDRTYPERLLKASDTIFTDLVELNKCKEGGFNVLTHGDLWVNNMLFNDDGEVIFVDFQLVHLTSPAIDLQFFMNTSLNEDVYLNHQEELLQEYHTALTDTLRVLGYGDRCITWERMKREMDDHGTHCLFAIFMFLPIIRADVKDAMDFESVMKDTDDGPPSNVGRYSSPRYLKALKTMLPVLESKGVF